MSLANLGHRCSITEIIHDCLYQVLLVNKGETIGHWAPIFFSSPEKAVGIKIDWILPLFFCQCTSLTLVEWVDGKEKHNEGSPHIALWAGHKRKKWFLLISVALLNEKSNMWPMTLRNWRILKITYVNLTLLIVFLSKIFLIFIWWIT